MYSKSIKSTEAPKANHPASRESGRPAKKAGRSGALSQRAARDKAVKAAERGTQKNSKQQNCLNLLTRPEGASIEELQKVTGWQRHSVRGFLAGNVKKKLGLTLLSEKAEAGPRRYRVSNTV